MAIIKVSADSGGITLLDNKSPSNDEVDFKPELSSLTFTSRNFQLLSGKNISTLNYNKYFDEEHNFHEKMKFKDFRELIECDTSTIRTIKAKIDIDRWLSELWVLYGSGKSTNIIKPDCINVSVREYCSDNNDDDQMICGGTFNFEASTNKDSTLNFNLILHSEAFSIIFNSLKDGDSLLSIDIHSFLYTGRHYCPDDMRHVSSVIDCREDHGSVFTSISSVTTCMEVEHHELALQSPQEIAYEEKGSDDLNDSANDSSFIKNDLSIKLNNSNHNLENINAKLKIITFIMSVMALFFAFNLLK
ncbi:hypothetical protein [Providencia huaxiensis]|uniref:hypothetical protein n=1 Tax=Providencia huaxiensis TaxID=2027290 RepID=UPI0032DA3015